MSIGAGGGWNQIHPIMASNPGPPMTPEQQAADRAQEQKTIWPNGPPAGTTPNPTATNDWWNGIGYSPRPQSGIDQDNALKAYWASHPPAPITDARRQNAAFANQQPMGSQKIPNQDMTYGQYWQKYPETAPDQGYFTHPEMYAQPGAMMAGGGRGAAPAPPTAAGGNVATSPRATSTPGTTYQSPGFQMQPGANPLSQAMSQYQSNLRAQVPQQYQQYLPANFAF